MYTAEHPALALLEVRVNLDIPKELVPDDYVMMKISVPDAIDLIDASAVDPADAAAAARFGDGWLMEGKTALLKVASAAAPESANYLINPAHPEASGIRVDSARPFAFDTRLFG